MAFELKQRLFAPQAAGIPGELAPCAQDAVAGHDDADRVVAHGAAHGAHGAGFVQLRGQLAVALALAAGHGQQGLPHGLLEGGAWRFVDAHGVQRGFVLTGKQCSKRMEWTQATAP